MPRCPRKSQCVIEIEDDRGGVHLIGKFPVRSCRRAAGGVTEGIMGDQPKEYSIAELIDHPGLGWVMTAEGIDRRSLELILDRPIGDRRRPYSSGDKNRDHSV